MQNLQAVSFRFRIRKDKSHGGKAPLYLEIRIDGYRKQVSTKILARLDYWDPRSQKDTGRTNQAKLINETIGQYLLKVNKFYIQLLRSDEFITHEHFRNFLNKKADNLNEGRTLLQLAAIHNQKVKEQVGITIVHKAWLRYDCMQRKLVLFLKKEYGVDDIPLKKIKYSFIVDFEHYLTVVSKVGVNHVAKNTMMLKKIIRFAVKNEWISRDPFIGHKSKRQSANRQILTSSQLSVLMNKDFGIDRLNEVRDVFVFCCYTGFAYADVALLSNDHIRIGIDGKKWIYKNREKTDGKSNVPLLQPAIELIDKYKDHPTCVINDRLLPVISNQRMNSYLKEIATICKFNLRLTSHIARHTFATTVLLSNGVTMETVSKLLGHKSLKTTQVYAKVLESKVSEEMNNLSVKLFRKTDQVNKLEKTVG